MWNNYFLGKAKVSGLKSLRPSGDATNSVSANEVGTVFVEEKFHGRRFLSGNEQGRYSMALG